MLWRSDVGHLVYAVGLIGLASAIQRVSRIGQAEHLARAANRAEDGDIAVAGEPGLHKRDEVPGPAFVLGCPSPSLSRKNALTCA